MPNEIYESLAESVWTDDVRGGAEVVEECDRARASEAAWMAFGVALRDWHSSSQDVMPDDVYALWVAARGESPTP